MKKVSLLLLILFSFTGCSRSSKKNEMVIKENFGIHQGKEVFLLTLTNRAGNTIKLTNYGARLTWIEVPDRMGNKDNITFGFETFEGTLNGDKFFGSTIGRYANRIANGRFTLDGIEYNTPLNDGLNTLHGGPNGWHSVVWTTEVVEGQVGAVKFSYISPDMEEGFPGTIIAEVTYIWTDENEIIIGYRCTTDDKKSVLNVTNHAYFNLHGAGSGDVLDHEVTIYASDFTPIDSVMIPTGEIRPVAGTPFDFKTPHLIGERINENYDQLILGRGYDHNYVLDSNQDVAASVYDPVSGRFLEVITNQPGLQFYTGNFLDGSYIGHGGKSYTHRSGFCMESGHYPDSPNQPLFPSTILIPGEVFESTTIYRFSVR